eukprot:TRINITY_DN811_c0_g1_i11.p4 TRINITY_DN811_c0_g1~~TRINITY_DN811_c0_g1_i11.p4  ORF type:complete len:161 (+),score=59.79 TRINITY_DN811_c0_g1_i11:3-485(+)
MVWPHSPRGGAPLSPQRARSTSPNFSPESLTATGYQVTKVGVQVWVRARPLLPQEVRQAPMPPILKMYGEQHSGAITVCNPAAQSTAALASSYRSFCVDKSVWSASEQSRGGAPFMSQEDVYANASDAVDYVVNGFNCTVMAYGQMRSGKTYTMFGPERR